MTAGGEAPYAEGLVLDLFCGTGVMAIEALSRGAAAAILVDLNADHLGIAERNLRSVGFRERATLVKADATRPFSTPRADVSVAFMDPPYDQPIGADALDSVVREGLVSEGCLVVWETAARADAPRVPPGFSQIDERRYGAARLSFLRCESRS